MSATKITIVVLVVVAALFAVMVLTGPWQSSSETSDSFPKTEHPTLQSMNSILAPFAPKVSAKFLVSGNPAVPAPLTFDLALAAEYKVTVLPDPSQKFRQLAFTATPDKSCMNVTYTPTDKSGLNQEESSAKSGNSNHPESFAFILLTGGGELDVKRAKSAKPSLCILSLQVGK